MWTWDYITYLLVFELIDRLHKIISTLQNWLRIDYVISLAAMVTLKI